MANFRILDEKTRQDDHVDVVVEMSGVYQAAFGAVTIHMTIDAAEYGSTGKAVEQALEGLAIDIQASLAEV